MRVAPRFCLIAAVLLAGCASGDRDLADQSATRQLPTDLGSLNAPTPVPPTPVPPTPATSPDAVARSRNADHSSSPAAAWDWSNLPHADWFRDPTCRFQFRWWSGLRWTEAVSSNGGSFEDPLVESDVLVPPELSGPVDFCEDQGTEERGTEEPGTIATSFPLSAEELGCIGPDPACVIGERGLPRATRLITYQELVDSGGYHPTLLHDHAPEGLPEDTVLAYLSECLARWAAIPQQRLQYGGTPVLTCSMVWRDMAYPLTYLGAIDDHQCVWEAFESFYLGGSQRVAPYIGTGWAERCASWLDPRPERQVSGDCQLPDGYYKRLTADARFADYGLSFDDPELSPEGVRLRWCSLLARCNDLWKQVAPTRYARFAEAGWPSPCIKRVSGHEINTVRKGRCEELNILASLVKAEGEEGLPTLPTIPRGLWFSC